MTINAFVSFLLTKCTVQKKTKKTCKMIWFPNLLYRYFGTEYVYTDFCCFLTVYLNYLHRVAQNCMVLCE